MINDLLTTLKMNGALEALPSLENVKDKTQFLVGLLQAEIEYRAIRAAKRRLSRAKFPVEKEWCDIDPSLNPEIDFSKIMSLGKGDFIAQNKNLCLMGQQGTGKTHSLIALGRQLCRRGVTVRFHTACELVNHLEEAKANHSLSKLMQTLVKPQLLIIDELGFVPFSENGARLLFDVFASRYERGPIAVSTNLSFDKWVQIFGTAELTAALVDRFTHRCLILSYKGQSVRLVEAKKSLAKTRKKRLERKQEDEAYV